MAIAFDDISGGSTSFPIAIDAPNPFLYFAATTINAAGFITVSSVTCAGVPLSKLDAWNATIAGQVTNTEVWTLKAPPTGASQTIAVTYSGTPDTHFEGATVYTGAHQTSPIDSHNIVSTVSLGGSGSSPVSSTGVNTVVVASNCWLVGCIVSIPTSSNPTAGASTTLRNGPFWMEFSDSNAIVGTGNQQLNYALSPSADVILSVMSLAPAVSAPPPGAMGALIVARKIEELKERWRKRRGLWVPGEPEFA